MGKAFDQHILDGLADVLLSTDYERRPFVADIEDGQTYWYTDAAREPEPVLKKLTAGKKKQPADSTKSLDDGEGDRTLSVGELPPEEEEKPEEKSDEEEEPEEIEDIRPKKKKVTFFIPKEGDIFTTVDLSIIVHETGKKDKMQLVEGIPLLVSTI